MEKKLKYPELEQGNYEAQTEAIIKQSKDMADTQEKRAKRDRDMAIFGDIANLVSKGAAMHGGAWKMNKDESMAAQGNAKLRALQESNSKQLVEYAKMRMNAADADRKERNAQKVAEYNAGVEQHKRDVEAQKYANEQAYKAREEARKIEESEARINRDKAYADFYNNGKPTKTGGGSSKEKNMRYLNGWGFDIDSAVDVDEAYYKLISSNPEFKVTEDRSIAEGGGEKLVKNPNTAQKRAKLIESGLVSREPKKTASVKKGSDKTMPGVGGSNNNKMPGVK